MAKENKKAALSLEERLDAALVPDWEQPYKVPANWCWVTLGGITQVIGGGTPSSGNPDYYEGGNVPWISPADLSNYNDMFISNGAKNITELGLEKSSARMLPKDTVCLSSRAPIGYVAIAANPLSTNQGFKSFLPSPLYRPQYLYWYLKANKELLESRASGTTFLELSGSKAASIEFPLAPLAEQQRIVDLIESLFAKLDEAKEKAQAVVDGFDARRAAILHKAFTGELTAEWRKSKNISLESWLTQTLKDSCNIGSGGTPSRKKPEYYDGLIPWIKTGEIDWNDIYDSEEHISQSAIDNSSAKLYPIGVVLVAMYGMGATRGRAAILNVDATTNQAVCVLQPKDYLVNRFLFYYFMCNYWDVREKAVGGNQLNLSATIIAKFVIHIPTIDEQKEIIRILDSLLSKEQQAKETAEQVIDQINTMKKTILARAFRCELGTYDPTDESAEELLLRVL